MLLATASAALGVSVAITLVELGVFGYVKGRFTGALSSQKRPASSITTSPPQRHHVRVPREAQTQRLCARHQVVESAGLAAYHRCVWLYAPSHCTLSAGILSDCR
jgi:hypothetical protein